MKKIILYTLLAIVLVSPIIEAGRIKLLISSLSTIAQKTWSASHTLRQKAAILIKENTKNNTESFIKDGVKYVAAASNSTLPTPNPSSFELNNEAQTTEVKTETKSSSQKRRNTRRITSNRTYRTKNQQDVKQPSLRIPFYVKTKPQNATVRIMNIKPKYQAGIRLKAGLYDIQISAPGYRDRRFWMSLNPKFSTLEVSLSKRGLLKCNPTFEGEGYFTSGQRKLTTLNMPGFTIDEVYFSFAKLYDKSNIGIAIDSGISSRFAYFDVIQSSNVTMSNIRNNSKPFVTLNLESGRYVKTFIGMEKTTEGVLLKTFSEAPPGAYFAGNDSENKEVFCMELENL